MGETGEDGLRLHSDSRVHLKFHGAIIAADAGLWPCRELVDDALGLREAVLMHLQDPPAGCPGHGQLREPGTRLPGRCRLQRPLQERLLPSALLLQPVWRLRRGTVATGECAQCRPVAGNEGAYRRAGAATAVFLMLLAALVGGCGGEDSGSQTGSQTDKAAEQDVTGQGSESTGTEAAEESAASLGESVTVGDVQWTVTDAEKLDELLSLKGEYEQGSFVIIDVTFSNNSNQDLALATPFFALIDSERREFEANIGNNFTYLFPEENMFVDPVGPGETKEGKIIFEVAPDSSGFRLQVNGARFASNETALIDLGL
jgi:hypothetical protein